MTTFDFVLLLIGNDFSVTQALLLVSTLIGIDIGLSLLKEKLPSVDKWLEGSALVIVENGKPLRERMKGARVDESDILVAARELQGLERMDKIKYAVLERTGQISIIPKKGA